MIGENHLMEKPSTHFLVIQTLNQLCFPFLTHMVHEDANLRMLFNGRCSPVVRTPLVCFFFRFGEDLNVDPIKIRIHLKVYLYSPYRISNNDGQYIYCDYGLFPC